MKVALRLKVFIPPLVILLFAVCASFINLDVFLSYTTAINNWILDNFSWLFSGGSLLMVLTLLVVFISPLGKWRLGGETAQPLLTKWRWGSITICTTTAAGMLFWGTAEPLYHLYSPPVSLNLEPASAESARFALSTMFMHWSITPFAIYAVPALAFALAFYNNNGNFSLSSAIEPVLGKKASANFGGVIDSLAMFALVAGMASSLGTGALVLASGISKVTGIGNNIVLLGVVIFAIMICFVASSVSGLQKGIARLSSVNTLVFVAIAILAFVFGPTASIVEGASIAFIDYMTNYIPRSLSLSFSSDDKWPQWWTVFYWANWLAWAPVVALFLGKIARGYTVRQFIIINWFVPASFSIIWMAIFSGTILELDQSQNGYFWNILQESGPGAVIYGLLEQLPGGTFLVTLFIGVVFLAYVTAADSNTEAISELCIGKSVSEEDSLPAKRRLKVLWGALIASIAWIMTGFSGVDGIKMMSNLGGFPALVVVILMTLALSKWIWLSMPSHKHESAHTLNTLHVPENGE
ncbi:BCCT family transporter [Vibrio hannami]|uniref:BCCT family transporter n=1 Tax=Vibrio hannami TaxID=2717094 RepID=UPI00240F2816|nr:BCCT family transporter [Vibrio hannami]MDG3086205.1 BCCT family transporter [Vibrio hannami]